MSNKLFLVLDMKSHTVISRHESEDAALDAADNTPSPNHVLPADDWESLATQDIKRFYNNLPGVEPVERFSDRAAALRRIAHAITGEGAPVTTPKKKEAKAKAAPKKKEAKAAPKKSEGKSSKRSALGDATLSLTAEGKKGPRFQKDSPRSKVFAAIEAAGSVTLATLEKKLCNESFTRGQLLGCLNKLLGNAQIRRD